MTNDPTRNFPAATRFIRGQSREVPMRYALLWLIGVPIPVLLVLYLMFH
jgi:hypothetical protein